MKAPPIAFPANPNNPITLENPMFSTTTGPKPWSDADIMDGYGQIEYFAPVNPNLPQGIPPGDNPPIAPPQTPNDPVTNRHPVFSTTTGPNPYIPNTTVRPKTPGVCTPIARSTIAKTPTTIPHPRRSN